MGYFLPENKFDYCLSLFYKWAAFCTVLTIVAAGVISWTHYRCPTINILDNISLSIYIFLMGKTIISNDNRFEWDEDKDRANIEKHGIAFEEILEVFDDPAFLTGYDFEHSETEDRYYGIGNLNGILIVLVFFTEKKDRIRLISARQAEKDLREDYYDYFNKING